MPPEAQEQIQDGTALQQERIAQSEESRAVQRQSLLSELESGMTDDAEPAAESPAAEDDAEEKPPEETPEVEESESEDEDAEESPEEDEDFSDDEVTQEASDEQPEKEDPVTAKRLKAIERAERRSKEAIANERKQLEAERDEWKPRIEKAERFERLEARAKYDTAGVLRELGVPEENFESVAKELYAMSKGAEGDPQMREAAARSQREREQSDEIKRLRERADAQDAAIKERDTAEATKKEVEQYMSSVVKSATDETPLVSAMLNNNADGTKQRLHQVAVYLSQQTGEVPDPEDVISTLEDFRREELKELGIDPALVFKGKTKKSSTPVADKKKTARTLSNELGTPTKPKSAPIGREATRNETLSALESGRYE